MAGEINPSSVRLKSLNSGHSADTANYLRSQMAKTNLDIFPFRLLDLKKWDDLSLNLPATPATTYLGVVTGTWLTNPPTVQSGDLHSAGSTTRRGRTVLQLPNTYVTGDPVSLVAIAGMKTNVADTLATLQIEAVLLNLDGTISADLATGGAQSINNLTPPTKTWTIDPTNLVPGSYLDCRVSMVINDAATGGAVIGVLYALQLRCNVQP